MQREDYQRLLQQFKGLKIAVIGDLMLDEYVIGTVRRISPEAPVPVVEWKEESFVPGGAANVVNNLLALGAQVAVFGVVGDDEKGRLLATHLAERGADTQGVLIDPSRITTCKTRVIAHSQQVVRLDREQRHPLASDLQDELLRRLEGVLPRVQAVVISDYQKGVLVPELVNQILRRCQQQATMVTANPKPPLLRYLSGAYLASINLDEAMLFAQQVGDTLSTSVPAHLMEIAQRWREHLGLQGLAITLGAQGMILATGDQGCMHVPAFPVEVYDTAGAGDTVIATMTCALTSGFSWRMTARVANAAAGSVVRHVGVVPPRHEEIIQLLAENHSDEVLRG